MSATKAAVQEPALETQVFRNFDDVGFSPAVWEDLLGSGDTPEVFLTWEWQRAWWRVFGRGELLLICVRRRGRLVAIAPLFSEAGMAFFVGSGCSDYLDFIGDVSDPDVLDSILLTAQESIAGFLGFKLYHIPETSRTLEGVRAAAERLSLSCFDEGTLPSPRLSLLDSAVTDSASARAWQKKSLVRHENFFRREGDLAVQHFRKASDILPHLPVFFEQHVSRWAATPYPSLFNDPVQRAFYSELTRVAWDSGWLRFTLVQWNGQVIACHFGFCYRGSYLWYKPSFDIRLARRSPGEVLLRQLLIAAYEEGAHTFDFGLGDEAFKSRFATHVQAVHTLGLYPEIGFQEEAP